MAAHRRAYAAIASISRSRSRSLHLDSPSADGTSGRGAEASAPAPGRHAQNCCDRRERGPSRLTGGRNVRDLLCRLAIRSNGRWRSTRTGAGNAKRVGGNPARGSDGARLVQCRRARLQTLGDPGMGGFSDAVVLKTFGEVPTLRAVSPEYQWKRKTLKVRRSRSKVAACVYIVDGTAENRAFVMNTVVP
jgi:hypothetical protein